MSLEESGPEQVWSATFLPGNENADGLRNMLEAKATFEALGVQFPVELLTSRLPNTANASWVGFQIELRMKTLCSDTRRTVHTSMLIVDLKEDGTPQQHAAVSMAGDFCFEQAQVGDIGG